MKNRPFPFMAGVAAGISEVSEAEIERMHEAGIGWLRCGKFHFDAKAFLENLDQPVAFQQTKERIRDLAAKGFRVLGITPSPHELKESIGAQGSPEFFENYQRICAFLGQEFLGLIEWWQVANELDIWIFRESLTMEQSAEMLRRGIRGLKGVSRDLKVGINITLFPSLPGLVDGNTDKHEGVFLAEQIYHDPALETDYAGFDSYPGTWREGGAKNWSEYLDAFHQLTGKPVLLQEFGYSSAGGIMSETEKAAGAYPCQVKRWKFAWHGAHTPEIQAKFIEESFASFASKPYVLGATYYCWKDHLTCWQCGESDCPAETAWGLLNRDGRPKPSYSAYQRAIQKIRRDEKPGRPPVPDRCFVSPVIDRTIVEVSATIADVKLRELFGNCFPNTLDTTVFFEEGAEPDSYVITGDISAMWLRDSVAQIWPYLPFAREEEGLRRMIAGVLHRQSRAVLLDAYANAFYREPVLGYWKDDNTEMTPGVHERKWELDSPAYFLRLAHGYWKHTGDVSPFTETWRSAVGRVLALLRTEQAGDEEVSASPYSFSRGGNETPNLRRRRCGLVGCAFRPSDDVIVYPYLIPANAMMAVSLRNVTDLLDELNLAELAAEARHLEGDIRRGLDEIATVSHPIHGDIWAYETDGYGNYHLMDDANVPSLLSLPYLGFCAKDHPQYRRTRAYCLSEANPWYATGKAGAGIGSPHTHEGTIWPISLTMQALTSTDEQEIAACLRTLVASDAGTGFMHESFRADDAAQFTRDWFAWANTLFGELILDLNRHRPHLLRETYSA